MNYTSTLSERLAQLPITLTFVHLGMETSEHESDGKKVTTGVDAWNVTLAYEGRIFNGSFKTGLGHRVLAMGVKKEGPTKFYRKYNGETVHSYEKAVRENMLVLKRNKNGLVGPDIADVVSCFLLDSQTEDNFEDWAGSLGYNSDSRKALDIYLECQKTRKGMMRRKVLNAFQKKSLLCCVI